MSGDERNLTSRPRRLRMLPSVRAMVRETQLAAHHFISPLFVVHGRGVKNPVSSMPGVFQLSVDLLGEEARQVAALGIPAVLLFGIPAAKDPGGSESFARDGIVQRAVAEIKERCPELVVVTDVCMC